MNLISRSLLRWDEMRYSRRLVYDRLRASREEITDLALKIIAFPHTRGVIEWRRQLIAKTEELAALRLRRFSTITPIGVPLACALLYGELTDGAADSVDDGFDLRYEMFVETYGESYWINSREETVQPTRDELRRCLHVFMHMVGGVIGAGLPVQSCIDAAIEAIGTEADKLRATQPELVA